VRSCLTARSRQVGRGSVQADFARQLAERNARSNPQKPTRNIVPKGTRLAAGYTDRTKTRTDEEADEVAQRIKNLEESMKLGQIDRETFENLVQEIAGGDVGKTHLVKGLDRKLLERVRRGEDVMAGEQQKETEEAEGPEMPEVEDAFDELAEAEVGPIVREKAEKKGEKSMMPPPPVAGVKRSRNDILKELKRQREEAAAAAAAEHEKRFPTLGPGFRKINPHGETTRIEVNDKGREILIVTGLDGKEKRKIRKQKAVEQPTPEVRHDLDDVSKPINMHNLPQPKESESEDEDIFEGVGSNYNPLANLDEDEESEEEVEDDKKTGPAATEAQEGPGEDEESDGEIASRGSRELDPGERTAKPGSSAPVKRDWFKTSSHGLKTEKPSNVSSADATVKAALAKVRNLDENSTLLQNLSADATDPNSQEARLQKRAAELAASDRDLQDMDLGFGASRFDDADEMEREGEKVKFSKWKGLGAEAEDDEDGDGGREAKKQRKRGAKKRKGDKNNAEDVLNVMARQKKEKKDKPLG
jgi:hypothetical protein